MTDDDPRESIRRLTTMLREVNSKLAAEQDAYSILMDVRAWVSGHMDAAGKVDANALDDYLSEFTDAMETP